MNAAGQPTTVSMPNSSETFTYDPKSNRMTQWQSAFNGKSQTGALTWNANGTLNQLQISDTYSTVNNQTCTYGYDSIGRLWSTACGSTWQQTYAYDSFGNITKPTGNVTFLKNYNTANHVTDFQYDGVGNVTSDGAHTYSYDFQGRPVTVDSVSVIYDAFGRVAEENNNGTITQFLYQPDGSQFATMHGHSSLVNYFVPMAAGMVEVFNSSGEQYVRHADWLGSSRLGTNYQGSAVYDRSYAPYGEPYVEFGTMSRAFTGPTQDTRTDSNPNGTTGLYDFLMRQQSPVQGRWLVPDPAGLAAVDITNPQSWNRYGYVRNNPLNTIDPYGLYIVDCMWDGCPHNYSGGGGGGYYGGLAEGVYIDGVQQTTFNTSGLGSGAIAGTVPWGCSGGACIVNGVLVRRNGNGQFGGCGSSGFNFFCLEFAPMPVDGSGTANRFAANNGLRAPDFISMNVNVGIPYLLNLAGPTVSVNIGRNGHVYIGPGVNVGKAATVVSGSVTANWMTQTNQMQSFLTKNSFSVNAGYWGGVQGAWTPGSGFAGGAGFVSPQGGGAWTYSFDLGQWFGGW